jgi:hypothetical protein
MVAKPMWAPEAKVFYVINLAMNWSKFNSWWGRFCADGGTLLGLQTTIPQRGG